MYPIARRRMPTGRSMAMFGMYSAGLLRPPNIRGQYDPRNVRSQPQGGLLRTLLGGLGKRHGKNAQAAQQAGFQRRAYPPRVMLDPRTGRPVWMTMPMQPVARGAYPPGAMQPHQIERAMLPVQRRPFPAARQKNARRTAKYWENLLLKDASLN